MIGRNMKSILLDGIANSIEEKMLALSIKGEADPAFDAAAKQGFKMALIIAEYTILLNQFESGASEMNPTELHLLSKINELINAVEGDHPDDCDCKAEPTRADGTLTQDVQPPVDDAPITLESTKGHEDCALCAAMDNETADDVPEDDAA